MTIVDPTGTRAWQRLEALREDLPTLRDLGRDDPGRFEQFLLAAPYLQLDLSRQRWTPAIRAALLDLWRECGLDQRRRELFEANRFNGSEGRAVLHTALRAGDDARILLDGTDIAAEVRAARARMATLVDAVRGGSWRGHGGASISDVVNIGIGGSNLGPALVCEALGTPDGPRVHFVANVDGVEAERLLRTLDPARTLFVIASKSFSTLETLVNARTARTWFLQRGGRPEDIPRHFVAISTNVAAAAEFGLPEANLLPMWDWVGGRFSMWSPVGLIIALGFGMETFDALLAGARAMDEHFRDTPPEANAPLQLALVEAWNQAFLGTRSHAVLPYSSALGRLPDYLQQLEMESNGKSVRQDGRPATTATGTVLWGNVGTTGQHAYHQLLHQGTQAFSAEFVLPMDPGHRLDAHHGWLTAHCFAQAEAFANGRDLEDVIAALRETGMDADEAAAAAPHRVLAGNHPSTMVLLDDLGAGSLGAIIALHEHKVFAQGMLWGINSFDQWGVELGKIIGDRIHGALESRDEGDALTAIGDATTRALVARARAHRQSR
ncbi:MAG TPA: glucose-6-phosphate isomerase [Pseudomonadales bacterium]|nr:glucose-6-phosphate isomerase [Pseudomonadales bacterium]